MKEVRDLLLRARNNWEILREFRSGKDFGKEDLKGAIVELRDCLLRMSVLILPPLLTKGFKPEQLEWVLNAAFRLRERFDTFLLLLEGVSDKSIIRAGLAIVLSEAPPIEPLLTFLEQITKDIDG